MKIFPNNLAFPSQISKVQKIEQITKVFFWLAAYRCPYRGSP